MVTPPVMPDPVESDEQLVCPLCDYDLRGLVDPRCPECGYTFDWADLRDPARRKHKYLFEHHPERNVRSYIRTMIGGLLPRRFWTGLLPSQPSRPRRLAIYALIIIVLGTLLPIAIFAVGEVGRAWAQVASLRRDWTTYLATAPGVATAQQRYPGMTVPQILDIVAPRPTIGFILSQRSVSMMLGYLAAVQTVPILWIAYTLASLTILQVSLSRARMRQIHLVRCVIYCADAFLWSQLLVAAAMLLFLLKTLTSTRIGQRGWWNDEEWILGTFAWAIAAMLPVFWYRLIIAFKRYLHFSHPISTILLTQFMVLLAVLLTLVVIVG